MFLSIVLSSSPVAECTKTKKMRSRAVSVRRKKLWAGIVCSRRMMMMICAGLGIMMTSPFLFFYVLRRWALPLLENSPALSFWLRSCSCLPCFSFTGSLLYANPIKATDISPPSPLKKFVFVSYRYSILLNWSDPQGEQQMQDGDKEPLVTSPGHLLLQHPKRQGKTKQKRNKTTNLV